MRSLTPQIDLHIPRGFVVTANKDWSSKKGGEHTILVFKNGLWMRYCLAGETDCLVLNHFDQNQNLRCIIDFSFSRQKQ